MFGCARVWSVWGTKHAELAAATLGEVLMSLKLSWRACSAYCWVFLIRFNSHPFPVFSGFCVTSLWKSTTQSHTGIHFNRWQWHILIFLQDLFIPTLHSLKKMWAKVIPIIRNHIKRFVCPFLKWTHKAVSLETVMVWFCFAYPVKLADTLELVEYKNAEYISQISQ